MLHINYKKDNRHYWKCRKANCRFTAITLNDQLVSVTGAHSHPAVEAAARMHARKENAKTLARNEATLSMKRVYSQAFADVNLEDEQQVDFLPSIKSLKSSLYRSRAKRLPKLPQNRAEIRLNDEWATTLDGRDFVLANDGEDNKILIFGTVQNLRLLCHADTIFMDGTFKVAPALFSQLYSIHIMYMGAMIPVCIALLPHKDGNTYDRFFQLICASAVRFGMQFSPQTICIDFEAAVITTIRHQFPNVRIRGCLFHYSQALWRKVQELGLSGRYKEDEAFNRLVRRASALPLVPRESVDEVWLEALNEVNDAGSAPFKDYVTSTWVDTMVAKFPVEIWTQDDNIDGVRTNNHLEGWHSTINRTLSRTHPNIFVLVEMLKEEQRR